MCPREHREGGGTTAPGRMGYGRCCRGLFRSWRASAAGFGCADRRGRRLSGAGNLALRWGDDGSSREAVRPVPIRISGQESTFRAVIMR